MQARSRHLLFGAVLGVLGTLLALFIAALAIAYGGAYDIAASRDHTAGVRWFLDRTMHASVSARAPDASDARLAAADVAAGAGEYKSMCAHCHGGPGVEPAGWSRGMKPRPPHMVEAAREWSGGEVRWIVEHGLKYTGMPAFGADHDDATLWNIAAFVKRLPGMTPEQYRAYGPAHAHGGSAAHGGEGATQTSGAEAGTPGAAKGHAQGGHAHDADSPGASSASDASAEPQS
jgi:mono/diheme cytochrome c family protein